MAHGDLPERDPVTVGPYRLVHRLGEGGMGVVHLALDVEGRAVAMKILRPQVAADEDARRRLGREVATLRRLRDPRVAEVIDADVDGPVPYLVTRFVPGRPLERVVREDGPLSLGAAAMLGRDLAASLKVIHASGVIHRDVKPANVMILDGAPVLIDFGIAHLVDESRMTMTGLVMGTPGYLSPEICDGEPVSEATDWWGWGATLAFALTGRPPFGTGPIEVVLDRVRRGSPDLDGVPDPLRAALAAALSTDPAQRPSADRLLALLTPTLTDPRSATTHVIGAVPPAGATEVFASSARTVVASSAAAAGYGARAPERAPVPQQGGGAATRPDGRAPSSGAGPAQPMRPDARAGAPDGDGPGSPGAEPPSADPEFSAVTPVAIALLLSGSALAAVAPGVAVVAAFVVIVVLRAVDRILAGFWRRRYERGPRRRDHAVAVIGSPWSLFSAFLLSLPAVLLPVLMGVSTAFLVGLVHRQGAPIGPDSGRALATGMAVGLVTAWLGPGGFTVRRAFDLVVSRAVPSPTVQWRVLAVLGLVLLSILIVAAQGVRDDTFVTFVRDLLPQRVR